jgi:hypothetical protein
MAILHANATVSFHPIPLGVWGGRKEKKKGEMERLWEIKHIFFALLHKSIIYRLWLCEAAKMLFAQPTDSISNSEKMVLLWYIAFRYIYIIYGAVFVVENAIF